jgi:hypothetical protein
MMRPDNLFAVNAFSRQNATLEDLTGRQSSVYWPTWLAQLIAVSATEGQESQIIWSAISIPTSLDARTPGDPLST